jgi:uncharacterized protein with HEPN domain
MAPSTKPAWLRLADMDTALGFITETVATNAKADAKRHPMTRFALERALEIVSEASRFLPDDMKARHPGIGWRRVADLGNAIRHGYDRLDWDVLWDILTLDAPDLHRAVKAELSSSGPPGAPTP